MRANPGRLLRSARPYTSRGLSTIVSDSRILVIKLGALGDFLYTLGPMRAIRDHHPSASLTLMTRPPFEELARRSGLFDEIIFDPEPKVWNVGAALALRRGLKDGRYSRIYDLQTSDRTGWYYRLLAPGARPEWSGIVPGCSHYHHYNRPTLIHTIDRQSEQLRIAGIEKVPRSDLSFMTSDISRFDLPEACVLLVPGSSARMAVKRWPATHYAALAERLAARGVTPVVLGGLGESDAIATIINQCPEAINLEGHTTIFDIPELGRRALGCAGNDTGPMHMLAMTGCPTVAIFSTRSFPNKAAPRGPGVRVLVRENLSDLSVDDVETALARLTTDVAATGTSYC